MSGWKMTMIEPTLEDLLEDDIMRPVMRSAGTDAARLRASLCELKRRLAAISRPRDCAALRCSA